MNWPLVVYIRGSTFLDYALRWFLFSCRVTSSLCMFRTCELFIKIFLLLISLFATLSCRGQQRLHLLRPKWRLVRTCGQPLWGEVREDRGHEPDSVGICTGLERSLWIFNNCRGSILCSTGTIRATPIFFIQFLQLYVQQWRRNIRHGVVFNAMLWWRGHFQDAGSAVQNGTAATTAHSSRPRSDRPTTSNLGSSNHGRALPGIHRALVPGARAPKDGRIPIEDDIMEEVEITIIRRDMARGRIPRFLCRLWCPWWCHIRNHWWPLQCNRQCWTRALAKARNPMERWCLRRRQCQQRLVWLRLQAYQLLGRQACRWCLSLWPQRVLSYRYPRKIPSKKAKPSKNWAVSWKKWRKKKTICLQICSLWHTRWKSKTKKAICKACTLRSELWARARTTY